MGRIKGSTSLYQITLKGLCIGIEVGTSLVIMAAPAARWCIGKSKEYVLAYWKRRGAKIQLVKEYIR